jgi:hypothetical protein
MRSEQRDSVINTGRARIGEIRGFHETPPCGAILQPSGLERGGYPRSSLFIERLFHAR